MGVGGRGGCSEWVWGEGVGVVSGCGGVGVQVGLEERGLVEVLGGVGDWKM